jgi:acyl-CoA thioester hydrolase
MSRERPFRVTIRPTWRDQDALGHVNNAVYSTWLENARGAYWKAFAGRCDLFPYLLARTEIDFRRPVTWNDTITLSLWISRYGTTSFDFEYALDDARDRRVADARTVLVMVDPADRRKRKIGPALRRKLEAFERRPRAVRP